MMSNDFINDLNTLTIEEMYNKYIIGGDIWYFRSNYAEEWFKKYDCFKIFISKRLGVHYNDIAIAGSAKLGFSINPNKKFKAFDETSDLDIIIVSRRYFYLFWDAYIEDSYAEIKTKNFKKVCFSIFRRYMDLDGFSNDNKTYVDWLKRTRGFEKDLQIEFDISNEINYRIFESWDAAKNYYLSSIKKVKEVEE